jgi:hypothetical protein
MGLALSTGLLADLNANDAEGSVWLRKQVVLINKLLAKEKLPKHVEPEKFGRHKPRRHVGSFPYSFLHYLRLAFARVREGVPVTRVLDNEDPAADPVIDDVSAMLDSHLICHSDCAGYYVPIDFSEVIFDTQELGLPGGMLGSSVRLMKELEEGAPAIGVKLTRGKLSDAEAKRLTRETEGTSDFWRERIVWLALYENARISIANKSLLVFH